MSECPECLEPAPTDDLCAECSAYSRVVERDIDEREDEDSRPYVLDEVA